jgi:hypothetical protein
MIYLIVLIMPLYLQIIDDGYIKGFFETYFSDDTPSQTLPLFGEGFANGHKRPFARNGRVAQEQLL